MPIKLPTNSYIPEYFTHTNPAILMSVYKKESTLEEYLIILVPLLSSVTNVRFVVSPDGTMGYVKYDWPQIMYNLRPLFEKENPHEIRPKILCLQEELMKCRDSHLDVPEGIISVKFPFPIVTLQSEHIVMGFSEPNVGCKILKVEVPAVRKIYSTIEKHVSFN